MKNCKTLVRSLALGGALLVGASPLACAATELPFWPAMGAARSTLSGNRTAQS